MQHPPLLQPTPPLQPPGFVTALQGYLAHKKSPHPSTLQQVYVYGPMVVLGGLAVSYARGTPVSTVLDCSRMFQNISNRWTTCFEEAEEMREGRSKQMHFHMQHQTPP